MKSITVLAFCLAGWLIGHARNPDTDGVILRGKILNIRTNRPVNAKVDIFCNSDFVSAYSNSESHGEFAAPLRAFGMYFISISAPGYVEASDTVWVLNEKRKVIEKHFYVVPIEVGLTVTLNNIYFEFGKAELSSQSFSELDNVVNFFRGNPGTRFEIAGHTDRNGPAEYNLKLSKDRAQSVVNYLTSHGVDPSQLIAQGYGATKPLGAERTREAEARNRRVEFTVLKVSN